MVLLGISCKKENAFDCFKPNGKETSETRSIGIFDSVEVRDKFDVTISSGNDYSVEVTAGKNIIHNISTKITNRHLVIENNNKCNFVRGYKRKMKIHITTPRIKKLYNNGVGPITFDANFKQDTLTVRAENSGDTYINGTFLVVYTSSHGNGDMYLKGSAKQLLVYSKGTNFTHAEDFSVTELVYISSYSLGDARFNVAGSKEFNYYIWSDGNIYYKGNAVLTKELSDGSAKGKAIKED